MDGRPRRHASRHRPLCVSAILELDTKGKEERVLRALPEGEWVCFDERGILEASEGVPR